MLQAMLQGVVRLVRGAVVLSGAFGALSGCGGRADEAARGVGSSPEDCSINQELICEAQGSSAAKHCECQTMVPRTAEDCALPEQFACGDAGAQCYCDDRAGCSPGFLPACDSYAPQSGCGCFSIYTR